jgi:hypothetical protein
MSNTETTSSKTPTHTVYQVREGKSEKGFWTRVGAAWPTKNGNGFSIQLDAVPLDGRIIVLPATEKKD